MDFTQTVLLTAELIGTFAFAFSGSVVAIQRKLDVFGTIVLGVITAVGGGMIRDITLGAIPPALFHKPVYVIVAAVTSFLIFCLCYFNADALDKVNKGFYAKLLSIMDSIGLGIFTVIGVNAAVYSGYSDHAFLAIAVGAITGVGGGIMRDLLAMRTPVVLHKHVYAVASIAGASIYYILLPLISDSLALLTGACIVIAIRLLASHFQWNLPVANTKKNHE
ncbi:MAG: trimeric intracellular cation channel family protein [Oscillospiraceae bacterium]